jgi:hypothetical protein
MNLSKIFKQVLKETQPKIIPIDIYTEKFINSLDIKNPTEFLFKLCQLSSLIGAQFNLCKVDEAQSRLHNRNSKLYEAIEDDRLDKIRRAVELFNQKTMEFVHAFPSGFLYLSLIGIKESRDFTVKDLKYGVCFAKSKSEKEKEDILIIVEGLMETTNICIGVYNQALLFNEDQRKIINQTTNPLIKSAQQLLMRARVLKPIDIITKNEIGLDFEIW